MGGVLDVSQYLQVLGRWRESESIRGRQRRDPIGRIRREQIHGEREHPATFGRRQIRPDLVQIGPAVGPQDGPEMVRRRLEPAVLDSALLERPDARDAIVRLSEHELAEQADGDEQQGRADESDLQLRPNLHRYAGDALDERIPDPSPSLPGDPRLALLGQDLRERSSRRPCS